MAIVNIGSGGTSERTATNTSWGYLPTGNNNAYEKQYGTKIVWFNPNKGNPIKGITGITHTVKPQNYDWWLGKSTMAFDTAPMDPFAVAARYGYSAADFANDPNFATYWKDKSEADLVNAIKARSDYNQKYGVKTGTVTQYGYKAGDDAADFAYWNPGSTATPPPNYGEGIEEREKRIKEEAAIKAAADKAAADKAAADKAAADAAAAAAAGTGTGGTGTGTGTGGTGTGTGTGTGGTGTGTGGTGTGTGTGGTGDTGIPGQVLPVTGDAAKDAQAASDAAKLKELYGYIDTLDFSPEQKVIMKQIAQGSYTSGQKVLTNNEIAQMIQDAAKNAETDLTPYYNKISSRELEDIKTNLGNIREDAARYATQEANSYAKTLANTKQSLRSRGLTFSGITTKTLGNEGAIKNTAGIEGAIPTQRRLDYTDTMAGWQQKTKDLGTEAERNLGSEAMKGVDWGRLASPYGEQNVYNPSGNVGIGEIDLAKKKAIEESKWSRIGTQKLYL